MSDSLLLGAAHGLLIVGDYEESLQFSLFGLRRKRKKITAQINYVLWDILECATNSALKLNRHADYEELRDFAFNNLKPVKERQVGELLLKLSMWGHSFKDSSGKIKLAELAQATDDTWGEPDFLLGWYTLPSNDAVDYFKKAIVKDSAYKKRIFNDEVCKKYPELLGQLN